MKLLVKAYGKKNIAELTPKKVLVTSKNKKPYWMTTYARTGEIDKWNSKAWTRQLLYAIADEDPKRIREAVEHGANVNVKDKRGWFPLKEALMGGYLKIARYLLDHGADLNMKDENERRLIDYRWGGGMTDELLNEYKQKFGIV